MKYAICRKEILELYILIMYSPLPSDWKVFILEDNIFSTSDLNLMKQMNTSYLDFKGNNHVKTKKFTNKKNIEFIATYR